MWIIIRECAPAFWRYNDVAHCAYVLARIPVHNAAADDGAVRSVYAKVPQWRRRLLLGAPTINWRGDMDVDTDTTAAGTVRADRGQERRRQPDRDDTTRRRIRSGTVDAVRRSTPGRRPRRHRSRAKNGFFVLLGAMAVAARRFRAAVANVRRDPSKRTPTVAMAVRCFSNFFLFVSAFTILYEIFVRCHE